MRHGDEEQRILADRSARSRVQRHAAGAGCTAQVLVSAGMHSLMVHRGLRLCQRCEADSCSAAMRSCDDFAGQDFAWPFLAELNSSARGDAQNSRAAAGGKAASRGGCRFCSSTDGRHPRGPRSEALSGTSKAQPEARCDTSATHAVALRRPVLTASALLPA